MSGIVVNNIARASGTIAATPGGLDWSTAVVTASTATVEAGKGYFINTTSNACTVTLPSSADPGDQIVLADYARTWGTNAVTLDSNGLNLQGEADTYIVTYDTAGQSINLVFSDSTKGWLPVSDDAVADVPVAPTLQRGIFPFGQISGSYTGVSNLVNTSGVIASDVTAVGTAKGYHAVSGYGGDKAAAAFGYDGSNNVNSKNLISNSGVVADDVSGVGTARGSLGEVSYGGEIPDKGLFAYGDAGGKVSMKNLLNSSGVIAADVTGVGTARDYAQGAGYGTGLGIFYGGRGGSGNLNLKNLVNISGVIAADATGAGTARYGFCGMRYGSSGQAMFAFGRVSGAVSVSNLISNTGGVGSDVGGVGTARRNLGGCQYGGDKGVIAYGYSSSFLNVKNLVGNNGVVAADVTGVGTERQGAAAQGYGFS